jgi:hypothetical protein
MRYKSIPLWLKELAFVTDFFSWLFALLSRLAEPFMLLSVLYVVAEAGVPSISSPALHNLSIAIMICSPEIILPGAFVVARQSQQYSRLLFTVCWCFVTLTLVTLVSLFVWRMTGEERAWLMSARCATAFAYSILMRVISHGSQEQSEQTEQSANKSEQEAIQQLLERIEKLTITVTEITTRPQHEQLSIPERTITNEIDSTLLATNSESEQEANNVERIRSVLTSNPVITDRELAAIAGVAPSTANKWRKRIEQSA